MIKEFTSFLKHYGVIGLAIAVIIGGKLNDLVSAVVSGLLMPIVGRLTAVTGGDWRAAVWGIVSIVLSMAVWWPFARAYERRRLAPGTTAESPSTPAFAFTPEHLR